MANRKRKCKMCGDYISDFVILPVGVFCTYEKAIEYVNTKQGRERVEKAKNQTFRERRKKFRQNDLKTQRRLAHETFRRYIRLRDKGKPCITCGYRFGIDGDRQVHAGHWKSVGAHPGLDMALNEDNCHAQCSICNNHLSGNAGVYRERLVERIGRERVLALEKYRPTRKWTAEDWRGAKKKYQNKIKALGASDE